MAADRLVPVNFEDDDEEFLSPEEIIRRLRGEFSIVDANKEIGRQQVDERMTYIRRRIERGRDLRLDDEEKLEHLKSGIGDAHFVYFADDPDTKVAYLTSLVMPDEPLFFGYTSSAHHEHSRSLLERCAKALGYDIEK